VGDLSKCFRGSASLVSVIFDGVVGRLRQSISLGSIQPMDEERDCGMEDAEAEEHIGEGGGMDSTSSLLSAMDLSISFSSVRSESVPDGSCAEVELVLDDDGSMAFASSTGLSVASVPDRFDTGGRNGNGVPNDDDVTASTALLLSMADCLPLPFFFGFGFGPSTVTSKLSPVFSRFFLPILIVSVKSTVQERTHLQLPLVFFVGSSDPTSAT
jgi:hypothetical protein